MESKIVPARLGAKNRFRKRMICAEVGVFVTGNRKTNYSKAHMEAIASFREKCNYL